MSRRSTLLGLVAVLALVASACQAPGTTDDEEGLTEALVWGVRSVDSDAHVATADAWNEQNPDTPVRLEMLPAGADQQRSQISLELNAESDLFDVVGLDVIWTGEFAENGWLESLEDLRPEVEEIALGGPLESATYQGDLWALPYNTGAGLLYYRTDLVDEPPTTWDELMEVGLEIGAQEGIAPFVGQGAQYEGLTVNFLEYFWSAGGDLFNEDMTEVPFGEDDAAQRAVEFMRTALENDFYAPGYNTMQEEEARVEFQAGNAVFMRHWPAPFALLSDEEESDVADRFDIAPLPTFTGEGSITAVGGYNLAVSAFSNNTEAAKEFIQFAATDRDVQIALGERAILPTRADVYEDLADDRIFEVLGDVLPYSRARPPVPRWGELSDTISRNVFEAYNGQQEPQQAIDTIRDQLESIAGQDG